MARLLERLPGRTIARMARSCAVRDVSHELIDRIVVNKYYEILEIVLHARLLSAIRQSNHGRTPLAVPQIEPVLNHIILPRLGIEAGCSLTSRAPCEVD